MGVIRGQIHVLIIGPLMCSCMSRSRGGGGCGCGYDYLRW